MVNLFYHVHKPSGINARKQRLSHFSDQHYLFNNNLIKYILINFPLPLSVHLSEISLPTEIIDLKNNVKIINIV